MLNYYETRGPLYTLNNQHENKDIPPAAEITQEALNAGTNVFEILAGYFIKIFKWFENLFKNWQLVVLGAIACLILWKKI